ncbi:hypothetical protein THAOC_09230, partial [Thalassiosira oceanica]
MSIQEGHTRIVSQCMPSLDGPWTDWTGRSPQVAPPRALAYRGGADAFLPSVCFRPISRNFQRVNCNSAAALSALYSASSLTSDLRVRGLVVGNDSSGCSRHCKFPAMLPRSIVLVVAATSNVSLGGAFTIGSRYFATRRCGASLASRRQNLSRAWSRVDAE